MFLACFVQFRETIWKRKSLKQDRMERGVSAALLGNITKPRLQNPLLISNIFLGLYANRALSNWAPHGQPQHIFTDKGWLLAFRKYMMFRLWQCFDLIHTFDLIQILLASRLQPAVVPVSLSELQFDGGQKQSLDGKISDFIDGVGENRVCNKCVQ